MAPIEDMQLLEPTRRSQKNCSISWKWVGSCAIAASFVVIGVIFLSPNNSTSIAGHGHDSDSMEPNLKTSEFKKNNKKWWSRLLHGRDPYDIKVHQDLQRESYIRKKMIEKFKPLNIRDNLRNLTKNVHVAGTQENLDVAQLLIDRYRSYGLEVKASDYDVFLTYPDYKNPNRIHVQRENYSEWMEISNGLSEPLGPPEALSEENDPKAPVLWNSYSAQGTAVGKMVYANHGSIEDYKYLDQHNISLKNAIVLCRYGGLWRGAKVVEAEKRGAIGVIIYTDPQDYGPPANQSDDVFLHSIYMPPEGAQRGSTMQGNGDPLTPFYPTKPYVFRSTDEQTLRESLVIPKVSVMPIGYRDAKKIFENMDGTSAPKSFIGGIQGVTYRLTSESNQFKLDVRSKSNYRGKIRDVCAYLRGVEETDRMVIFSNHFDAWTFGAHDPNSGTAAMLEMGRVLMAVVNETGWRPRRTMVLCQWDAEEYGLIGSNEWVEEFEKLLNGRAVALINMDIAVKGNVSLTPKGVPLMYEALMDAAKQIPNPNADELQLGRKTVYDSWLAHFPDSKKPGLPKLNQAGSGSDHYQFMAMIGVPVVDYTYTCAKKSTSTTGDTKNCYYLYHSMYEVSWTLENLVDQGFKTHAAVGQLSVELGRSLADSLIIPFNVTEYAIMLQGALIELDKYLQKNGISKQIPDYGTVTENLNDAANRFLHQGQKFQAKVTQANSGKDTVTIRQKEMLNSRLTLLDRSFINPRELYPTRQDARHVIFASSIHDNYAASTFAGVRDTVEYYLEAKNEADKAKWLKLVRIGLTDIQYSIESAILGLDLSGF